MLWTLLSPLLFLMLLLRSGKLHLCTNRLISLTFNTNCVQSFKCRILCSQSIVCDRTSNALCVPSHGLHVLFSCKHSTKLPLQGNQAQSCCYQHMMCSPQVASMRLTPQLAICRPDILSAGESDLTTVGHLLRFVFLSNFTGLPAISVPAGQNSEGKQKQEFVACIALILTFCAVCRSLPCRLMAHVSTCQTAICSCVLQLPVLKPCVNFVRSVNRASRRAVSHNPAVGINAIVHAGMPVSMQVIGRPWAEADLLSIGSVLEHSRQAIPVPAVHCDIGASD